MKKRTSKSQLVLMIVLGVVGLLILIPFLYMVVTSLKSKTEIMAKGTPFFPKEVVWCHYQKVLKNVPYFTTLLIVFSYPQ